MRITASSVVLALALALASCAGADDAPQLGARIEGDSLILETGEWIVPAGGEIMECFYTDLITDRELAVSTAAGHQLEGGHHVIAYYTLVHQAPGHHPCDEAEMASWSQVAGADGSGSDGGDAYYVDGLATRIPAGAQIVMQAHYVNFTGGERTVHDSMDVHIPSPGEIRHYGGTFFVHQGVFEIPARSGLRVTTVCRIDRDLQLALLLGHMHEHGSAFSVERLAGDAPAEMLYETEWSAEFWSHPPANNYGLEAPLSLPAGTELRMTCEWENATDGALLFPHEMCVTYGRFFPADDEIMIECENLSREESPL